MRAALLDRFDAGREGHGAGRGYGVEDLLDDGLAHRIRLDAGAADRERMGKLQSHSTSNPTSIAQKAAVEALPGRRIRFR